MSPYPFPPGTHAIPASQLDLRPDSEIDAILANPAPITSDKNIWLFWDTSLAGLPPHHLRTVRAYHRRFSKSGWTIRCLDLVPASPLNVSAYLDTSSPDLFPAAFREGKLEGRHAAQHTSDLVRWPLLLTHGGAYVDVGLMPIGDLDALWASTVANPESEIEVLSYDGDCATHMQLMNYFMASRRGNPLFERCHRLFLKLWEGRTSTDGMSADPLLSRVPLMDVGSMSFTEDGKTYGPKEVSVLLSDYIAQGQVISLVLGLVDPSENWDGPAYAARKVHAMEFMAGAQLVNELTAWNGKLAYDLLSLKMPGEGATESEDQGKAREIVEQCLARSFAFKLATGLILRVKGDTLGSLWRKNPGKDDVDGTYASWLRWGMVHANPDVVTARVERGVMAPLKTGRLLEV